MWVSLDGKLGYFLNRRSSSGELSSTLNGCSRLRDLFLLFGVSWATGFGGRIGSGGWFCLCVRKQTTEQLERNVRSVGRLATG